MSVKGSWINSAKSYEIKDGMLYAKLYNYAGNINDAVIKITDDFSYSNNNGNFEIEEYTNTMFIIIGNQLGNCLRVIISALIIAERYKYNVFIDMTNSQLMEKEKQIISSLFPRLCKYNIKLNTYDSLKYDDVIKYKVFYGTNYNLIEEGRFVPITVNNFAITSTIYSIIPIDMSNGTYIRKKIEIYKTINYPEWLINNSNNFDKKYNLKVCIGFHIRYSDNLNDTAKKRFNTNIKEFYKKIDTYNNEKILLCSDNKEVIKHCIDNYKNIIVADKYDNQMFQALYEMMLLSKTKLIIGSNSSTFSYEAAFMKGTNIELFENNTWKLYELSKY